MTWGRRSAKCFIARPAGCGGGGKSATKRITTGLIFSCAWTDWGAPHAASPATAAASASMGNRFASFMNILLQLWNAASDRIPPGCAASITPAHAAVRHRGKKRASSAASGGVPLYKLPRNDDALHLVGAFADAHEGRVAHQALDRVLLGIAVGAVDAHGLERVLQSGLGGEVFRHAGLHVAAPALVVGLRRLLDQQARRLHARGHLAQLELDRLVLGDRLAEGLARLGIAHRVVERRLGDAGA